MRDDGWVEKLRKLCTRHANVEERVALERVLDRIADGSLSGDDAIRALLESKAFRAFDRDAVMRSMKPDVARAFGRRFYN